MENGEVKLLWDMNIQCDNVVEARRPDVIVVSKKEKNVLLLLEFEKIEKYQDLKWEFRRTWNVKTVK